MPRGGCALRAGASLARHGEEPQVVALQYKGLVLAIQGLLDSALSTAQEAVTQAEALNFPLIVPFASAILGMILLMRREFAACIALSSRQLEFCAEHGFVFWSAAHQILRGAARAHLDASPEGLAEAEAGIRNWGRTGAALHVPTWSSFLADAALAVGDLEVAEKALSNKREQAERRGELYAMAELLRLEGRIDAHRGQTGSGSPSTHGRRSLSPAAKAPASTCCEPAGTWLSLWRRRGTRSELATFLRRSLRPLASTAMERNSKRRQRSSRRWRGTRTPRRDEFPLLALPVDSA